MTSRWLGALLVLLALVAGVLAWWANERGSARDAHTVDAHAEEKTELESSDPRLSDAGRVSPRDAVEADADAPVERPSEPPTGARLFGTFTDADDGRPVVGLELGVRGAGPSTELRTAVDGSFAFELSPGAWTFFARAQAGRVPFVEELVLAPGEERELSRALGTARTLCVRVWRAELGGLVPCAGAELWLIQGASDGLARTEWPRVAGLEPVRTDHEGHAELAFADFERYVLTVEHVGHLPYSAAFDFSPFLSWLPFSADGCIDLALEEAGARARGHVLDPDGRPLAGVLVGVLDAERHAGDVAVRGAEPGIGLEFVTLRPAEFPAFTTSAADGGFALALPRRLSESTASVALIAIPGRAEFVHHAVQTLSASELIGQSAVELRLPHAGEVELEFVDEAGAPRDGIASVRDADGLGHGRNDVFSWLDLDPRTAGRRLLTQAGRLRLRHPGGSVRVGLSPEGRWDEREFELAIPAGAELRHLRVVVPH